MIRDRRLKIVVADDNAVYRIGLRGLLPECDPSTSVVAEASTLQELLARVTDARPDVILIDLHLPDGGAIDATRRVKRAIPEVTVIVMADDATEDQIFQAIQAGAASIINKDEPLSSLVAAIRAGFEGRGSLPPAIAQRLMDALAEQRSLRRGRFGAPSRSLTERERTVLRLIAEGKHNREIAACLDVSERTVGNHVASIYRKIDVADRAAAVRYAVRARLIEV